MDYKKRQRKEKKENRIDKRNQIRILPSPCIHLGALAFATEISFSQKLTGILF